MLELWTLLFVNRGTPQNKIIEERFRSREGGLVKFLYFDSCFLWLSLESKTVSLFWKRGIAVEKSPLKIIEAEPILLSILLYLCLLTFFRTIMFSQSDPGTNSLLFE